MRRALIFPLVLLLLLLLGLAGWTSMSPLGAGSDAALGIADQGPELFDRQEVGDAAVSLALAVLAAADDASEPPPDPVLTALEGRLVSLEVFRPSRPAVSDTARGEDLDASVRQAARALRQRLGPGGPEGRRIRLAVPVEHRVGVFPPFRKVWRPARESIGTFGLFFERRDGSAAAAADGAGSAVWILGAQFPEDRLYNAGRSVRGVPLHRIRRSLSIRYGIHDDPALRLYGRVSSVDWTDDPEGPGAVRLRRGYVWDPTLPTADILERKSLHAADYLARHIDEEGRYTYRYLVMKDAPGRGYNLLRHAGSTWSLLQAYRRFQDPAHLEAAKRAVDYFLDQCELREEKGPWGDDYRLCIFDNYAKLGANGLGLLMITEYMETTGDMSLLRTAQELARFVIVMQEENGHFLSYFDWGEGAILPDEEVIYYPGEACFGLMQLHRIDKNQQWVDTVKKGVDFMIFERDAGKGLRRIPHDHWLMYALSLLYNQVPEPAYLAHGELISEAIRRRQHKPGDALVERYPDMLWGYYRPINFTPGGTRGEALTAMVDLANLAGKDSAGYLDGLLHTLVNSTYAMYSPVSTYAVANPSRTMGGIPEGQWGNTVRNDFVQHNLSAMLGAERHLRVKEGGTLPGGIEGGMGPVPTPEERDRWESWRRDWKAGPTARWPVELPDPEPAQEDAPPPDSNPDPAAAPGPG